jgi:hypothetical protein
MAKKQGLARFNLLLAIEREGFTNKAFSQALGVNEEHVSRVLRNPSKSFGQARWEQASKILGVEISLLQSTEFPILRGGE